MVQALGNVSYVMYGKDSGYPDPTSDSEPATTCDKFFWHAKSISFDDKANPIKHRQMAGGRDVSTVVNGRWQSNLKIEGVLDNEDEAWELVLGAIAGGGPYTVTPANQLPTFAVEVGFKDYTGSLKRAKYHGCKVNSFNFSFGKAGDPIKYSLDIVAQKLWLNDTLQTPTAPTSIPFTDFETQFEIPNGTEYGLQSFDWTVNHNLKENTDNRTRFIYEPIEGPREYSFNMTRYQDTDGLTLQGNVMGASEYPVQTVTPDTEATMELTLTKGSNSIVLLAGVTDIETVGSTLDLGGDLAAQKFTGSNRTLTSVVVTQA